MSPPLLQRPPFVIFLMTLLVDFLLLCNIGYANPLSTKDNHALTWVVSATLEDPTHALSLEQVSNPAFETQWQPGPVPVSFGFSQSAHWFKIEVDNPTDTDLVRVLLLGVHWHDTIDLFQLHQGALGHQWQLGDQRPYQAEFFPSLSPAIPIHFPSGFSTLYLRLTAHETMMVPIDLQDPLEATQKQIRVSYYFGAIYGALLIIALYNFFLYLSIRKPVYLFYSLFIAAFVTATFSYNGVLYHALLHDNPTWATKIHPHLFFLYQYSGLLFVSAFLKTKQNHPAIHRYLIGFGGCLLVMQIIITLFDLPYFAQTGSVASATFYSLLLLTVSIRVYRSKGLASQLLTYAILSSIVGTLITTFVVYSVLPYHFALFHMMELGFVIDAALLSFALAADMKRLMQEKSSMQAELIRAESEKKRELETLVQQRTASLALVNEKLEKLSVTDDLTQLKNRLGTTAYLQEQLTLIQRYPKPLSILLLDIDLFKQINDAHGHLIGDQVLQRFAQTLRSSTRNTDTCGRWGGEEFIIICPETTLEGALQLAHTIQAALRQTEFAQQIDVTVSIGIASANPQDSQDTLISRADTLMYQAKKLGRNTICH